MPRLIFIKGQIELPYYFTGLVYVEKMREQFDYEPNGLPVYTLVENGTEYFQFFDDEGNVLEPPPYPPCNA